MSAANITLSNLSDLLQQLSESLFRLCAHVVVRTSCSTIERVRRVVYEVMVHIANVGTNRQQAESGCLALENLHRRQELVNDNTSWLGGHVLFVLCAQKSVT